MNYTNNGGNEQVKEYGCLVLANIGALMLAVLLLYDSPKVIRIPDL